MAFNADDLARMNVGTKSCYFYDTTDAIATVIAADYFLDMGTELKKGDVIFVAGSTGGTPTVDVLVVNASDGSTTTVVNGT